MTRAQFKREFDQWWSNYCKRYNRTPTTSECNEFTSLCYIDEEEEQ